MDATRALEEYFGRFPGIGPRQAKRFVYHLLSLPPAHAKDIAHHILHLHNDIRSCERCFRFFQSKERRVCPTCAGEHRDPTTLMVVAKDVDLDHIEKSGAFRGYYFVLGGTVPILEKEPHKRIRIRELVQRMTHDAKKGLREVILSLNSTPEGDHTEEYIESSVRAIAHANKITISVLGRGLSTGLELEYSDGDTIKHAVHNRSPRQ